MLMNLKSNSKVGKAISETASIAYTGELLPTGTTSYGGISIDATKRYLKNSGKDKTPALVESGQGKFFNGTNQYINTGIVPNQAEGTLVTRFTYATGMANRYPVGKSESYANGRFGITINANGKLVISFGSNGSAYEYTPSLINGKSYHVAFKHIGNVAYLYVDGLYVGESLPVTLATHSIPMHLGAFNVSGAASTYFNNVIDETYYYDVALPDTAIQSLYLNPEKVKPYNGAIVPDIGYEANCKLFLPLCENSGSNVYNVAVNPKTALAITNYTTAMHTSAAKLSYGAQCTAWKRDSLGVLLGMSNGLSFDGGVSVKPIDTGWLPVASNYVLEFVGYFIDNGTSQQNAFGVYDGTNNFQLYYQQYLRRVQWYQGTTVITHPNLTSWSFSHLVIKHMASTGKLYVYRNGVLITETTNAYTGTLLKSLFVGGNNNNGTLAAHMTTIMGTPKIHKGTQYAKFNIGKSWKAAQKIIAKLGA